MSDTEAQNQEGVDFSLQFSGGQQGYSQPPSGHSSYIRELTDHSDELEKFYLQLLGMTRDGKGTAVPIPGLQKIVNEQGANRLMAQLSSILHSITDLTSLSESEIKNQEWENMMAIISLITEKSHEWALKNDSDKSAILTMFYNYMHPILNRAHMDRLNDKKFFRGITQEQTTKIQNSGGGGGSFFSKLNPWSK